MSEKIYVKLGTTKIEVVDKIYVKLGTTKIEVVDKVPSKTENLRNEIILYLWVHNALKSNGRINDICKAIDNIIRGYLE